MIDRKPPAADVPYVGCDLADTDAVAGAVESLAGKVGGRITGVFTPAGIDSCGTLEQVPAKDWEQVIAVNLVGTAAVIRAALPYLKATGAGSSPARRRWASRRSATPPPTAHPSSGWSASPARWRPSWRARSA